MIGCSLPEGEGSLQKPEGGHMQDESDFLVRRRAKTKATSIHANIRKDFLGENASQGSEMLFKEMNTTSVEIFSRHRMTSCLGCFEQNQM